jgi:translation elongation factor EF-1beta
MAELEAQVRTIEMEGLLWGTGKLVAIGYGIKKLQVIKLIFSFLDNFLTCVIVDDLVSTDLLEEKITDFEDFVQSVDVVAFNKI